MADAFDGDTGAVQELCSNLLDLVQVETMDECGISSAWMAPSASSG